MDFRPGLLSELVGLGLGRAPVCIPARDGDRSGDAHKCGVEMVGLALSISGFVCAYVRIVGLQMVVWVFNLCLLFLSALPSFLLLSVPSRSIYIPP